MDRTPRTEKVAVVDEVRKRFDDASAVLLTEYRGISVAAMTELRRSLTAAGGDYKVYKNTLVRLAVADLGVDGLSDLLVGPTALAFVQDDAAAVAKSLKDFGATNENLIIKGALLDGQLLDESQVKALADLPSRDELLARFAGGLQAPMSQFAALLNATMAKFAYGIQALIDAGDAGETAAEEPAPAEAEAQAEVVEEAVPADAEAEAEVVEKAVPAEAEADAAVDSTEESTPADDPAPAESDD